MGRLAFHLLPNPVRSAAEARLEAIRTCERETLPGIGVKPLREMPGLFSAQVGDTYQMLLQIKGNKLYLVDVFLGERLRRLFAGEDK